MLCYLICYCGFCLAVVFSFLVIFCSFDVLVWFYVVFMILCCVWFCWCVYGFMMCFSCLTLVQHLFISFTVVFLTLLLWFQFWCWFYVMFLVLCCAFLVCYRGFSIAVVFLVLISGCCFSGCCGFCFVSVVVGCWCVLHLQAKLPYCFLPG